MQNIETNTKKIEEMYGRPIAEWTINDFNIIAQTKPEIADLLDVATCRENAARTDLPMDVKKIFVGYTLIIAFKNANDYVEEKLQEWNKKYEKSENPVSSILAELETLMLDEDESDYARARAVNTMLAYWSVQDDAKNRCQLCNQKDVIKHLVEAVLEDIEFMGVRMFLLYTMQYIDLIFSTGAFYHQIYEEDLLQEYEDRLNKINDAYTAIMKEMEELILQDPELKKQLESVDPEELGMPDIFKDEEKNESDKKSSTGETTESV